MLSFNQDIVNERIYLQGNLILSYLKDRNSDLSKYSFQLINIYKSKKIIPLTPKILTMETPDKFTPNKSSHKLSTTGCILKLERSHMDIQQLEKQLTSYIFEPNTYLLFLKSETIRQNLAALKRANVELLRILRHEKHLKIELFEKTILQIRSLMEIKTSVEEYSRMLRY